MSEQLDPRVVALTKQYLMEVQVMHMRLSAIRQETLAMGRADAGDRDPLNIAIAGVEVLVVTLREVLGMPTGNKVLRGAQGLDGKMEIVQ